MSYVKTADLAGNHPRRNSQGNAEWAFCPSCYGNETTPAGKTTDENGDVCLRCDGSGTLWIMGDTK